MKRSLAVAVLSVLTLFSISAFAKDKSAQIEIYEQSQVGGTTLQPGTYTMKVNPTGDTANVVFLRNNKQVATVTGQVVQLAKKSNNTSVTTDKSGSVPQISEIDLQGQQAAIKFTP